MLRALNDAFCLLLAHAVETRAQNARARGSAYWACLVSEEDMQTPRIVFNYKSGRTRCPRVGVSLECDVQSWHPSAPEESSRARRNLRQLFLHPRAANEEPDKVERQIFDSTPSHRAVAPAAGPNDEADLGVMRHFLKNLSLTLKVRSRATGK